MPSLSSALLEVPQLLLAESLFMIIPPLMNQLTIYEVVPLRLAESCGSFTFGRVLWLRTWFEAFDGSSARDQSPKDDILSGFIICFRSPLL